MAKGRQRGFTLIELLVVIAIIAILASLLLPVAARAKEQARTTQCRNNVRQMVVGLEMYADDHNRYPLYQFSAAWPPTTWNSSISHYVLGFGSRDSPFYCPSFDRKLMQTLHPDLDPMYIHYVARGPYGYNGEGFYSLSRGHIVGYYTLELADSIFVKPADIIAPAQMIAIGDTQFAGGFNDGKIYLNGLSYRSITSRSKVAGYNIERAATQRRHKGRFQIGFVDGHIETIRYDKLFADTPEARRLFTRDNQPHEEWLQ